MSIINHDFKHIFIHNPKTAGSSMERQPWIGGNGHAPASTLVPQAPDYFSWGFVRHPCDRLLSFWASAIQHAPKWPTIEAAGGFNEFIFGLPKANHPRQNALISQAVMFCYPDEKVAVDFVGRFEYVNDDWPKVCDHIGVDCEPLPRANASEHKPWRAAYTREMIVVVQDVYQEDFRVFGYE
jgi:hypothetical protein